MVAALEKNVVSIISPNCSDLAPPSVITKRFPDGESYCRLENYEGFAGKKVVILHRLFPKPDENLITLLQMMYGAKENGAKEIELIIPYLPYARSDKAWLTGEVVSARLLIRLLKQNGANKVITWDCHFLNKPGEHIYEGLRIVNYCLGKKLVAMFREAYPKAVVVSPDIGAKYLVGEEGLFMRKKRGEYEDGTENTQRPVENLEANFDLRGKEVILIDDMIAGGGTMAKATQKCLDMGATDIYCAATHGMFLKGAIDRLQSAGARRISTTNTIKNPALGIDIKKDIEKLIKGEELDGY